MQAATQAGMHTLYPLGVGGQQTVEWIGESAVGGKAHRLGVREDFSEAWMRGRIETASHQLRCQA